MRKENTIQDIKTRKILICDDDKAVTDFLERFLKKEGYKEVDIALSGQEALNKITKNGYQLVFLDIRLPGIDGIQTLKRIKDIDSKIDVIVITAFPEIKIAEQAMKMGAYDYIVKPFDLAYLKLVVLTKIFPYSTQHK